MFREKIQVAARTLHVQRKIQSDRHGEAKRYEEGTRVWIKLHRRSDASRRLTRKIHLVYDGPYVILREIRRNAYLIGDENGSAIGIYNSRQIRPHRETRYAQQEARIDALRACTFVPRGVLREVNRTFVRETDRDVEVIDVKSGESSPEILFEHEVRSIAEFSR